MSGHDQYQATNPATGREHHAANLPDSVGGFGDSEAREDGINGKVDKPAVFHQNETRVGSDVLHGDNDGQTEEGLPHCFGSQHSSHGRDADDEAFQLPDYDAYQVPDEESAPTSSLEDSQIAQHTGRTEPQETITRDDNHTTNQFQGADYWPRRPLDLVENAPGSASDSSSLALAPTENPVGNHSAPPGDPNQKGRTSAHKLFIGRLAPRTTSEDLREHFQAYGEVMEAVVITGRARGESRGFGFCSFTDPASVDKALADEHVIHDTTLDVRIATSGMETRTDHESQIGTRLFVGGLHDGITEATLETYFRRFGDIESVAVLQDPLNQRNRGFGFVIFRSPQDAINALGSHPELGPGCEAKKANSRARISAGRRDQGPPRRSGAPRYDLYAGYPPPMRGMMPPYPAPYYGPLAPGSLYPPAYYPYYGADAYGAGPMRPPFRRNWPPGRPAPY